VRLRSALISIALLLVPAATRAEQATGACGDMTTPYAEVQIDTLPRLNLEIARTPAEHQVGLMFRGWDVAVGHFPDEQLQQVHSEFELLQNRGENVRLDAVPDDSGMLFVYDRQATEGYWMHNTLTPLSIAWIDRDGTIVDIQDMQPLTDDVHWPAAPYWYSLEANLGWFANHGAGVGQQVLFCLG
jgi:uncharacterized membrane protein (UPF0127 family)